LAQLVPATDDDADTLPFGDSIEGVLAKSKPLCLRCGYEVDPFRAQLKSKSSQKESYICNNCNAKATMLSRTTTWPLPEFLQLSQDEQQKFWRECHALNGAPAIKALLTNTIVQSQSNSIQANLGGEYLPLSVWQTKGFDIADIEAKCKDTMQHPVLGKVYRVPLLALSRVASHETVRKNVFDRIETKKPKIAAPPLPDRQDENEVTHEAQEAEDDDGKDKLDESEQSSSSKDSSSSSSSDSSSRRKKKKKSKKSRKSAKKSKGKARRHSKGRKGSKGTKGGKRSKGDDEGPTKKEMLAMQRAEKQLELEQKKIEAKAAKDKEASLKAQAAFLRKLVCDAQKCLTATYPVQLALDAIKKEKHSDELSTEIKDSINTCSSALTTIKVEAQATMNHCLST
jgi:hypothetical protein